jgi:hypothetical protein
MLEVGCSSKRKFPSLDLILTSCAYMGDDSGAVVEKREGTYHDESRDYRASCNGHSYMRTRHGTCPRCEHATTTDDLIGRTQTLADPAVHRISTYPFQDVASNHNVVLSGACLPRSSGNCRFQHSERPYVRQRPSQDQNDTLNVTPTLIGRTR